MLYFHIFICICFLFCKRAEFSKSCKLIGSERAVFFTVLPVKPANDQTVVTALFPSFFLVWMSLSCDLSFKFLLFCWSGKSELYYWDKNVCPLHDTGPMPVVPNEIALFTSQVAQGWALQGHRCDSYWEFKTFFVCARPWNIYCLVSPLRKFTLVQYHKPKAPVLIFVLATFL